MRRNRIIGTALALSAAVWLAGWIGTLAGLAGAVHVENVGWAAVAAVAAACAFSAALQPSEHRARTSFAFFGAGLLAWALGQAAWTVYGFEGVTVPYPSLSDVGYLGAMPFFAAGVLTWPRRRRVWTSGALIDGALAAGAVAVVSYTFSFEPIFENGVTGAQAWLGILYPASELALVAIIGGGLLFDVWTDRGRVALVGLGLLSLAAADTFFAVDALDGSLSPLVDGGWTLALAAMGAASLLPNGWPARVTRRVPEFLPAVAVTGLLGVAAASFAIRELGQHGWQAADAVAVGFLLVLVA
ncbi:MAG: hypothetical protein ABI717_09135, partial [Actinomycetota bacterium]